MSNFVDRQMPVIGLKYVAEGLIIAVRTASGLPVMIAVLQAIIVNNVRQISDVTKMEMNIDGL
ncbi:MAG: hypothetical protein A2231_01030 [Candidatus Firestonebacteria bacterium RIFOXYA2_FULL_40_8]|nr:MAG: hypothetical protein A2231_01030 [Candidatus Firestonebacteria bacterium RIFOXYA2_FULL_40_8]